MKQLFKLLPVDLRTNGVLAEKKLPLRHEDAKRIGSGFLCALAPLRQKVFLCILVFLNIFMIVPGYSQQQDSLYQYLEIAAKNNPVVLQRFAEYQASLQKIPQAGSLSDPQLDLGVFLTPMELISGKQVAEVKLMQMFPWFGVLRNARDEMSQMANARFEQFRDAKFQAYFDVQRTWYELYKLRKDINISEKNIDILKVIERLALIRYKTAASGGSGSTSSGSATQSGSTQNVPSGGSSGMKAMTGGTVNAQPSQPAMQSAAMGSSPQGTSLSDLYRIQIETGDLENNIALLKNQEQTLTAEFNSYLNRTSSFPVFTTDTLTADSLELPLTLVPDSITANNPMLKMIEYEKKSYSARKKMVKGMGYPMVGLGLNYSIISTSETAMSPSMNGRDMIMPMVSVTIPVYRKKYNAMQKEAELLGASSSYNYQAASNTLQTEYYQAVQLYQDAQRRVKLYENQYQLASKSLDLMLRSFSTSSSDMTDVLRVRQQTLDYELNKVEAIADLNRSIAWLKRLMATPGIK